ncbi:MAG: 5-formyltetrahydrofolate cyclo-ligase [Clostridia bacterium]|nr:5-formyltetrahydrofolate cyclo-ligase [Clostridia bacterium]
MTNKETIREQARKIRASIPEQEHQVESSMVRQHAYMLPQLKNSKVIFVYASKGDEVDTWPLIDWLLRSNKTVLLPMIKGDEMIAAEYYPDDILTSNRYGVLEPDPQYEVDPSTIEVAFVPGLAFDEKGNRVGTGGGYYDKFLARIPCVKVGMCFDKQIVEQIEPEEHDVRMDAIATNKRLILCY